MTGRRKNHACTAWFSIFLFFTLGAYSQNLHFVKLSVRDYRDFSRVIVESSFPFSFDVEKSSSFLFIKIGTDVPFRIQRESFRSFLIDSLGWTKGRDYYMLAIKAKTRNFSYDCFSLKNPTQLVIDFKRQARPAGSRKDSSGGRVPLSSSPEKNPPLPSQGIKTIVIDPGHGGLETGAKGKFGTLEKDITMALSLKLKEIIEHNLAYRVVLTRDKDVDVSLENRAALANNHKADLFISIHVNSSYRKEARGSEAYFLSLNATDEEARRLAYLENNRTELEERIAGDDEDNLKMILWDMAQTAYLKRSSQLAESIQKELNMLLGTVNRGIKQAPFKVLTGVACPAVLLEVAFLSNPEEERKLLMEDFQRNVAWATYRGLVNFARRYPGE